MPIQTGLDWVRFFIYNVVMHYILSTTHTNFKLQSSDDLNNDLRRVLRETFGDNDPYESMHTRAWITFPRGDIYIRKDLVDDAPSILTFLMLKTDRKSTRLNSSHTDISRMPSSA